MNILMVGAGHGSWQVRGQHLGAAIGARTTTHPQPSDWRWADLAILVKHAIDIHGNAARQAHLPVIWDAVDFWQQPEGNSRPLTDYIAAATRYRQKYGLVEIIAATRAMAQDIGGVYLPHHSRPKLVPTAMRSEATVVAYEGQGKYLGWSWLNPLKVTRRLGLTFVVNPPSLASADIIVAFRGGKWDGAVCRRWKSGIKLVNAIAAGRPVLTQPCAAFDELQPVGYAVESGAQVEDALRSLMSREMRQQAMEQDCAQYDLATIARRYRGIIEQTVQRAAA